MTRMFALVAVLIAVVAMAAPSLAMGTRGWASAPIPVVTVQPDGSHVRGPCLFTGSKSVSPCRPDLGVLPVPVGVRPPAGAPLTARTNDAIRASLAIEPVLRPPRSV